jgi:regulator of RNase E activity RraA
MMEPVPPAVLERLRHYDTPTLSNAIEEFDIRPRDEGFASIDIKCIFPELGPMVGYAATAAIRARGKRKGEQQRLYGHVLAAPGPRIVVVKDLDDPPAHGSLWGEVNANVFLALGCIGVVTDGSVRDLNEVRALGFHFFARGAGVSHAYVGVEAVGDEVEIGGLKIGPGDLLHADQHGVLLIPKQIAADLPAAADRVILREKTLISWLQSNEFDSDRIAEMKDLKH